MNEHVHVFKILYHDRCSNTTKVDYVFYRDEDKVDAYRLYDKLRDTCFVVNYVEFTKSLSDYPNVVYFKDYKYA